MTRGLRLVRLCLPCPSDILEPITPYLLRFVIYSRIWSYPNPLCSKQPLFYDTCIRPTGLLSGNLETRLLSRNSPEWEVNANDVICDLTWQRAAQNLGANETCIALYDQTQGRVIEAEHSWIEESECDFFNELTDFNLYRRPHEPRSYIVSDVWSKLTLHQRCTGTTEHR